MSSKITKEILKNKIELQLNDSKVKIEPDFTLDENYYQSDVPNTKIFLPKDYSDYLEDIFILPLIYKEEWIIPTSLNYVCQGEDILLSARDKKYIYEIDKILDYLFKDNLLVMNRIKFFRVKYGLYKYFEVFSTILRLFTISMRYEVFLIKKTLDLQTFDIDNNISYILKYKGNEIFVNNLKNYHHARILFNDVYSNEKFVPITMLFYKLLFLYDKSPYTKHKEKFPRAFIIYREYKKKYSALKKKVIYNIENIKAQKYDSVIDDILFKKTQEDLQANNKELNGAYFKRESISLFRAMKKLIKIKFTKPLIEDLLIFEKENFFLIQ